MPCQIIQGMPTVNFKKGGAVPTITCCQGASAEAVQLDMVSILRTLGEHDPQIFSWLADHRIGGVADSYALPTTMQVCPSACSGVHSLDMLTGRGTS